MKAPVEDIELEYDDGNANDRVPVVLIHAFPLHRGMWEPQAPLEAHARLIRFDLRGFGQSPAGDGLIPFELHVDDLLGLMDHLKLPSAVLCGVSMGGYVALRAAERAPERVRGLILCDTKSQADDDAARLKRAATVRLIKREGLEAFAETFVKGVLAPQTLAAKPEVAARVRELIGDNTARGACAALIAMAGRTDTTAALARLDVPALVLVGEKDALTPLSAAKALAAGLPKASLAVLPAAGHLSSLENPEAFNREASSFLKRL